MRTTRISANNYILGLNGGFYNPSACLLKDGRLVAWAAEERFARVKTARGQMPANAIKYCLQSGGISIKDVDCLAFGWDATKYPSRMQAFFDGLESSYPDRSTNQKEWEAQHAGAFTPEVIQQKLRQGLQAVRIEEKLPPVVFVPHHLSHAASAYYASGFDGASILVADGLGEEMATSIWVGEGRNINLLESFAYPHSLGQLYEVVTAFLGFRHHSGEGKVMGLAPYGQPNSRVQELLSQIIAVNQSEGTYEINPAYLHFGEPHAGAHFTRDLVDLLGLARRPFEEISQWHKDLAFGLQDTLESAALGLTRRLIARTGNRNLCIAGGVGMNCKMNGAIYQSGLVDDIFIQPASSDEGTALGAASYIAAKQFGLDPRFKMTHAFWGPGFTNDYIRGVLVDNGVPFKFLNDDDLSAFAAEQIAQGLIVGWFQGRMEIGARALGNRSILADPRDPGMKDRVNSRIKFREAFRPFCPSLLAEAVEDYLEGSSITPFMIQAFSVRTEKSGLIPSVVHVDGTARPQSVQQEVSPLYWSLIDKFRQITGVPVVLNTSFNVRGMPIVLSPEDALDCFKKTGLDVLVLGNYVIKRLG